MMLIIDLCWKKDSLSSLEFVNPVKRIVEGEHQPFIIKHFLELNEKDLVAADKIIMCGTALKDNEFRKHLSRFSWLRKHDKPVLGICAGMQIIGLIYGTRMFDCKELGMWKIMTKKENIFFSGVFQAYELHGSAIRTNDNFEVLAKSSRCVQMIKHKNKHIYGVSFHPEIRNETVIKKFLGI